MAVKAQQDVPTGHVDDEAVNFLQSKCREVWWTSSRVPTTKQVSATDKREMVQPVDGQTAGYSISKRVFASKHPAVQRVNMAFRAFDELRDHYTIVKSASATHEENRFQVDPGRRIIRISDIDAFEAAFADLKAELEVAVNDLAYAVDHATTVEGKHIDSVKEMDRKRLGRSFNEKDYPTTQELRQSVRVTLPQYGTLSTDMLLPAAVLERETKRVSQELSDTVALATTRISDDLIEAMTSLARSLSYRTFIDPLPGDPWRQDLVSKMPVEVTNVLLPAHDPTIPTGSVRLKLAWKEGAGEEAITKEMLSPVMTMEEYQTNLRPKETSERRQIRSGAISKLQALMDNVSQVRAMLGNEGEGLEKAMQHVKNLMANCARGGTATATSIAADLKASEAMATTLQKALSEAVESIHKTSVAAVSSRRKLKI